MYKMGRHEKSSVEHSPWPNLLDMLCVCKISDFSRNTLHSRTLAVVLHLGHSSSWCERTVAHSKGSKGSPVFVTQLDMLAAWGFHKVMSLIESLTVNEYAETKKS